MNYSQSDWPIERIKWCKTTPISAMKRCELCLEKRVTTRQKWKLCSRPLGALVCLVPQVRVLDWRIYQLLGSRNCARWPTWKRWAPANGRRRPAINPPGRDEPIPQRCSRGAAPGTWLELRFHAADLALSTEAVSVIPSSDEVWRLLEI